MVLRRSVVATVAALALAAPATTIPAVASGPPDEHVADHEQRPRLSGLNETIRQYAEGFLDEHAHTVDGALAELHRVEAELADATTAATTARAQANAARADADTAEQALDRVRHEQRRTIVRISTLTRQISAMRAELGSAASAAYRLGGAAGWSVRLDTDTRELAALEAERSAARVHLRRLRAERQDLTEAAAAAATRADMAEEAGRAAAERLAEIQATHAEILAEAEAARAEERERYQDLLAESEALEEWLAEYGSDEAIEGTGTFVRPGTGRVTSPFGPRLHPILGYVRQHTGIDIGIGDGFIYAADHGVVVEASLKGGYGYMVVIDHGVIDGRQVSTLYAHQPGLSVDVGMPVAKGQPIGSVGSTGLSTGPHLHFEVRVGGVPVDPWPWIRSAPMPEPTE